MSDSGVHTPLVGVAGWRGEQQLVTLTDVDAGQLLVGEYPIAFVETQPGQDEVAPWLLLDAILSSEAMTAAVTAAELKLTKWPLSADHHMLLDSLGRKHKRNPQKLAQLYHRIAANNLRYVHRGVMGYGIWPMISRVNHSCDPNAKLCASAEHPLAELLLSTRPISKGTPVGWNYLSEPGFLTLDWHERNRRIYQDFQFLCRCARCESERPPGVAAMPKADIMTLLTQSGHPGL